MRFEAASSLGHLLFSIAPGSLVSVDAPRVSRNGVEYSKRLLYSSRKELGFCEEG